MRHTTKISMIASLSLAGMIALSCGSKKSEKSEENNIQATNVAELKLSNAFKLELPAALVKASGATSSPPAALSTRLTGKKSSEACRTVDQIKMLFSNLSMLSGTMCHLEAESAQIKFGVKYKLILTKDAQTREMPLWVDNSVPGALNIYTCKDGKLAEKIAVSAVNSNGPKGALSFRGSENGQTYAAALEFDFTTSGVKLVKGQNTYAKGSDKFSQDSSLDFRDSGLSFLKIANKGSMEGMTFADRGTVKHNGTFGQALYKGEGTYTGGSYSFSNRATFDADGYKVANTSAPADIVAQASELPAFLADGYSIPEATGWDCTTAETVTLDLDSGANAAAHAACESDHSNIETNCWGDGFEQGEMESIGE